MKPFFTNSDSNVFEVNAVIIVPFAYWVIGCRAKGDLATVFVDIKYLQYKVIGPLGMFIFFILL